MQPITEEIVINVIKICLGFIGERLYQKNSKLWVLYVRRKTSEEPFGWWLFVVEVKVPARIEVKKRWLVRVNATKTVP